jgi:hypothetical protein
LVNQFMERYRTEERRNVRSSEVSSLVIESLVLKKKRECEMEKEESLVLKKRECEMGEEEGSTHERL